MEFFFNFFYKVYIIGTIYFIMEKIALVIVSYNQAKNRLLIYIIHM